MKPKIGEINKGEVMFSWDWKEQPELPKIIESIRFIQKTTGKFPNCYEVETLQDEYALLLSINEYDNTTKKGKEQVRNIYSYIWTINEECEESDIQDAYKVAYGENK